MTPPEPQNFGFKFPASGSVPVLFSSMGVTQMVSDLLKPRVWENFSRDACSCRETLCECSMARFGISFSFIKLTF